MAKWRIPAHWTVYGEFEVEANTLDDAVDKVDNMPLPDDASYSDGSFEIYHEGIERLTPDKINDEKKDG